jgi:hypothetical protein
MEEPSLLGRSKIQLSMCIQLIQKCFPGLTVRPWKYVSISIIHMMKPGIVSIQMVRPKKYSSIPVVLKTCLTSHLKMGCAAMYARL